MKRILLLGTVAALMAVMLVMSAAPAAFAHSVGSTGKGPLIWAPGHPADSDGDGNIRQHLAGKKVRYTDDHAVGGPYNCPQPSERAGCKSPALFMPLVPVYSGFQCD